MEQSGWIAKAASIERAMGSYIDKGQVNGDLLIAKDGEAVLRMTCGWADRLRQRKLTADTMFNVASVGKTITAAAVLLLVQRGRLALDETIGRWFPDLPYKGVTVRHLLSHTSGIPNYIPFVRRGKLGPMELTEPQLGNAELLDRIVQAQPEGDFAPGTGSNYSNTGYLLLAMLIERVTGRSFHDYLDSEILRPFGFSRLTECRHSDRVERIPDFAVGYYIGENGQPELPYRSPDMAFVYCLDTVQGDGNFHSSAPELLRWDRLLKTEKLLSRPILEEAYRPVRLPDGTRAENGLCWFVSESRDYGVKAEHSGYWPGYSAEFVRYLDADVTVIFMSNEEREGSYIYRKQMMQEIENICFAS